MRSSTSSSDRRTRQGRWGQVWTLALGLALVAGASMEVGLRGMGFRPSVLETPSLWGLARSRVYASGPQDKVVVLLGMSRMHLDVDPRVFAAEAPGYRVVQLAIPGTNPLPILRDLARDPRFNQTLILSLQSSWLMSRDASAQEYVQFYEDTGRRLNSRLNTSMEAWVQSVSVLRSGVVNPGLVLERWMDGQGWPEPSYIRMNRDRSREADYTMVDLESMRTERLLRAESVVLGPWINTPPSREVFAERLRAFLAEVGEIEQRGGKVVVVRLPTGGAIWELEQQIFPRGEFWDLLAREADFPTLHFQDVPSLRDFQLPDMSHLDFRDAPNFTRALVDELKKRGIL